MARERRAPGPGPAGELDRHEDDLEYQRSPAGQREAEEYWALNNRLCGGSGEVDPWRGRGGHPRWYYMWL